MMHRLILLLLLLAATLSATEFGTKEFTIKLSGKWGTSTLIDRMLNDESVKLTAYCDLTGKVPLLLNIVSMESFGDLYFHRRAIEDELYKNKNLSGGIVQTSFQIGRLSAIRMEYILKKKRIVDYLLVENGRMWMITFICPEKIPAERLREIDRDAASFRLLRTTGK